MYSFEDFCSLVLKELKKNFDSIYHDAELRITHPFKDKSIPLMEIVFNRGLKVYPVSVYRIGMASKPHYHDVDHMVTVAGLAVYFYYKEAEHESMPLQASLLYLAGIFHDLEHSLGLESDDKNIRKTCTRVCNILLESSPYTELILETIRATQYPYVREPNNLMERCLVDADLSAAALCKNGVEQIFDKLLFEINESRKIKNERPISEEEMYISQMSFNNLIPLTTRTAKQLYPRFGQELLTDLRNHLDTKNN